MQWEEWTTTEKLHVGMELISLLISSTGLVKYLRNSTNIRQLRLLNRLRKLRNGLIIVTSLMSY